jgi:ABC-2 type transport system ATP-binding protein
MSTARVEGVSRRFGHVVALDDVNFALDPGITGLLGPNGAGKTTLLRLLATVAAPDTGEVELLGLRPTDTRSRVEIRRRLGYTPQEPGFHREFTTFAFVDYIAILKEMVDRRARHDEVRRVLDLVGLSADAHRRIRTVSGGMRRRIAIAQALLGDPDLLVLDEPTAGLDPEQRLRFRELLTARADRTVVLSTHQTDDIAALCRRVIVLLDGRVRFDGAPRDLAALADGRVWVSSTRDERAQLAWVTGDGLVRHLGDPPAGADTVSPAIEDGYLTLVGNAAAPAD